MVSKLFVPVKKNFNKTLSDKKIHILDPFSGTGTFLTRLIQSGLIKKQDLLRKYQNELHATEIILLAYYISAINIENSFHDALNLQDFFPFEGICLTDTFEMFERDEIEFLHFSFEENAERVQDQKNTKIEIIIGNPPYSVGQKSANDNNQNNFYEEAKEIYRSMEIDELVEKAYEERTVVKFNLQDTVKSL